MDEQSQRIVPILIEEEMKSSYIDYSMSVIVSRALPDVRDGLKPVHRRILVAMNDLSVYHDRPYRKSAKITGDVTGNYHPHGTAAVYDAMVRLVQEFSLRYPLIDGQGNFGSIDGDAAAAERYTEARLNQISEELLRDLERETVDTRPNYDETRQEPVVLPSNFPNLVVNGASGIAVGMATNIPPHNLRETVDALVHLIDAPDTTLIELMQRMPGPDFPTGGIILGRRGIQECYVTGRGLISVRARADVDTTRGGREAIIVTEIPYQVNKASMIERIADLVKSGHIGGISDIRDESDRRGMRVVIELKRDAQPQVVLNQLYKHTQMQQTFGANMLALKDGRPVVMNLKALLEAFLQHRFEVIVRRSKFELSQAEKRAHILEGLLKALDELDAVITLIRSSPDVEAARTGLMSRFDLSEEQANAILEMRLQRLTGLERKKIEEEYAKVTSRIAELKEILADPRKVYELIRSDLLDLKERFGDDRRTTISVDEGLSTFDLEDLIPEEDMVITISHTGYIKRVPVTAYRSQRRGGRGLTGATTKEEDFVERLFVASTHSYLLLFTDYGRCYWLKVYEIPQGSRQSRGRSILNLLTTRKEERIAAVVPVREFAQDRYIVIATRKGVIKKTRLSAFSHPRKIGIGAVDLREGDFVIGADLADIGNDVILATRRGKAIRFVESDLRPMGRNASGVRGVTLQGPTDEVVGMVVVRDPQASLLVVTEKGFGKRSALDDYRLTRRGGQGVLTIRASERNGAVMSIKAVTDQDELMIMSSGGIIIRLQIGDVSLLSRATLGVKLIHMDPEDRVMDVAHMVAEEKVEVPETGNDDLRAPKVGGNGKPDGAAGPADSGAGAVPSTDDDELSAGEDGAADLDDEADPDDDDSVAGADGEPDGGETEPGA